MENLNDLSHPIPGDTRTKSEQLQDFAITDICITMVLTMIASIFIVNTGDY